VSIRFLPFRVCLMNTLLVFRITIQDMTELNLLHLSSLLVLHPRYVQKSCVSIYIYMVSSTWTSTHVYVRIFKKKRVFPLLHA
jgi:hypothetical protein